MKKLLLILVTIAAISCKNEAPIDYAIISGKILNSEAKEIEISSVDRKINKKFIINSEGIFNDTLKKVKAGTFTFYDGKNYNNIHIEKGDNLKINYDAKDFKNTLTYTGVGSEVSNYILAKNAKVGELIGERNSIYKLEEAAYKAKYNEIKDAEIALISTFQGISEAYKTEEKKDIQYKYLNNLNKYQSYHSYYAKKPEFKVSEGFLDELNDLDYNNEDDYFSSQNYKYLVEAHYRDLAQKLVESDSIGRYIAAIKVNGAIPNEAIKNDMLLKGSRSLKYTDNMKKYYDLFMTTSTNEEDKKTVTESYNKLKLVAAGQPSPKFTDYENNAGSTTSLDDLKGKYVYIDVWATWCGPCIGEIPSLKKVEEKYHDKNIHFLSLSIDKAKDYDKWKKMIVDKELGGIQLLADNEWKSKFVQDYQIDGIPHFILLDPEGKIVKYSAPRPSNDKLIELFDELGI